MWTESTPMQDVVLWKGLSRTLLQTLFEDFGDQTPDYDWVQHIGKPDCINLQQDFPGSMPGGYKVGPDTSVTYAPDDPAMPIITGNDVIGRGPWWSEAGRILTWPYTYNGQLQWQSPYGNNRTFLCPTLFLGTRAWVHFKEPNLWGFVFRAFNGEYTLHTMLHNVHFNDRNAMVDTPKFVGTFSSGLALPELRGGPASGSAPYHGGLFGTPEYPSDPTLGPYTNDGAAWHIDEVRFGSLGARDLLGMVYRRATQFPQLENWPHIKYPRTIRDPSKREWYWDPFQPDSVGQPPVKGMRAIWMVQDPQFYYDNVFLTYAEIRSVRQTYTYEWTGFKWEPRLDTHTETYFPDVLDSTSVGFNKYEVTNLAPFFSNPDGVPGMYWGYWYFNSLLDAAKRPKS